MVVLNFTDRYKEFDWITELEDTKIVDLTSLTGCSRYCDDEAAGVIAKEVSGYSLSEPFYIDNGNYHYASCFRASLIEEAFDILLIDHHTDTQEPLYPLLSCGSWVLWTLRNVPHLNNVYMIGPDEGKITEIPEEFRGRIFFINEETALKKGLEREEKKRKLFVSVDLDVLSEESFASVWDQGTMKPDTLQRIISRIKTEENVCAIDICG